MLIPISWLKDFTEINLPLSDLMWKMTEAGLTCESYKRIGKETVLDVEVTANRPDWMSVFGVAREIAAIQGTKITEPARKPFPKKTANFPIDLVPDYKLFDRWSGVVIQNVKIGPSPKWLLDRIKLMGHTPINNVIDITNYVMYELGIPLHAFDYDEIRGQIMKVGLSKGGEEFTSVDNLNYSLPKDAIIIKDNERIIDLSGIKGGLNSGIKSTTKNIFLHVTIDNPVLIRRASISLGLRSEASAIYERVPDKGGVIKSLQRAADLILDLAGGKMASDLIDLKKNKFEPWNVELSYKKLNRVLGIEIDRSKVVEILSRLNLEPKELKESIICKIPTYRGDIKIEEDLIEEVARIYGYNKFPLTLPAGRLAVRKIPYYFDDNLISKLKELMVASGYCEAMTLSLLSQELIVKCGLDPNKHVKITNPVSLEYEYLRSSLIPSLIYSLKINQEPLISLFEIDKVYPSESYKIAGITKGVQFRSFKGVIDLMLERLNISSYKIDFDTDKPYLHPSVSATIKIGDKNLGEFGSPSPNVLDKFGLANDIFCFELDLELLTKFSSIKTYKVISENPPQIEDLTIIFPPKTRIGDVINKIFSCSTLVNNVELKDIYSDSYTFKITYQGKGNLIDKEVAEIRSKILNSLEMQFGGHPKN